MDIEGEADLRLDQEIDLEAYEAALAVERQRLGLSIDGGPGGKAARALGRIIKWDPKKHPRDHMGRFREVLNKADVGTEINILQGRSRPVKVKKTGRNEFDVRIPDTNPRSGKDMDVVGLRGADDVVRNLEDEDIDLFADGPQFERGDDLTGRPRPKATSQKTSFVHNGIRFANQRAFREWQRKTQK